MLKSIFTLITILPLTLTLSGSEAGTISPQGRATFMLPTLTPSEYQKITTSAELRKQIVLDANIPDQNWDAGHRGVDLKADLRLYAPEAGIITFCGQVVDREVLTIKHPGGLKTTLEPVTCTLAAGTQVAKGEEVGNLAATPEHCAELSCVHWGLKQESEYLDPIDYIDFGEAIVLFPRDWQPHH